MNFSKAFGNFHYDVLLQKLKVMGFKGVVRNLPLSYLANRIQYVADYDSTGTQIISSWLTTSHGIPQGSVLGQLLFLLYIDELPVIVSGLVVLYVDDIVCCPTEKIRRS